MRALVLLWVALLALWFLFVDTFSFAELIAGAASAAAGSALVALARREGLRQFVPRFRLVLLAGVLARVLPDLGLLARELVRALTCRREPGRFHTIELELPSTRRGDARRAAVELLGSLAPNTIVLGVDEKRVVVHQLVSRRADRTSLRRRAS